LQNAGLLEIITSAATHAVLPLLAEHPPSLRAQVLVARDHYKTCFGQEPRGIWLPECAYSEGLEHVLKKANLRWFITDTHGILHARPRPRYAMFAPILTPNGVAAFGRDLDSAKQVWSRQEGYPGDPRYRDFYRDIGFDLELEYLKPYLPAGDQRSFIGIKYYRITAGAKGKEAYDRKTALHAADEHAGHFLRARMSQMERLSEILDQPPFLLCPYDAELFGHWWYEGPEFLNYFVRKAYYDQNVFTLITPEDYLARHPSIQLATPAASSWGEGGYWGVWLDEKNQWIYPHLSAAQERMSELARHFSEPDSLQERALKQAARELLLAQSSDWPFILRTGTSPEYARKRVNDHLLRFTSLYEQLNRNDVDENSLRAIESYDNIFPSVDYRYWR
jgi:1,4-alpha-glucan branching enzyme